MPHYISIINWTDQGIRNVKDSPKRAKAARRLIERACGKLELYYTMDPYDKVAIVEAPDDAAPRETLLSIGRLGNVWTTTLKAFRESEAAKIIGKLSQ